MLQMSSLSPSGSSPPVKKARLETSSNCHSHNPSDNLVRLSVFFRWNCSSTSNSTYSYTFLRSMVCLWSVVCHIHVFCLTRSTDLDAIWQVDLWGPMTHCVRWCPWPQGKGRFAVKPPARTQYFANCCCDLAHRHHDVAFYMRQHVVLSYLFVHLSWCHVPVQMQAQVRESLQSFTLW